MFQSNENLKQKNDTFFHIPPQCLLFPASYKGLSPISPGDHHDFLNS